MSDNGRVDLDLTEFAGERMTVKLPDYEFSVSTDIRTALVFRLLHAFTILAKGADASQDLAPEHADIAEGELWTLLEEIMKTADPPPPKPVRELFGSAACTAFLGRLANKYGATTNSKESLPLPTSSEALSQFETSSEAEPFTLQPVE